MSAANATIGSEYQTIETVNGSIFTITKKSDFNGGGTLICGGANKVYVSFPDATGLPGSAVDPVTTDVGQVERLVGIDRVQLGSSGIRFPRGKRMCKFTSITGASVLYWIPDE